MNAANVPSVARVKEITAMDGDIVLRNLLITQCYHDLSEAVSSVLGARDGTWSMFGTWASKTAGAFIRGDEMPAMVRKMMTSSPLMRAQGERLHSALGDVPDRTPSPVEMAAELAGRLAEDVSLYVMQGNKAIFEEMGGAYSRFLAVVASGDATDNGIARFLAEFEPGGVEPDEATVDWTTRTISSERRGGQSLLQQMLRTFFLIMQTTDARRKAQLILYATAMGGVHEQTRLQTYIQRSLDAPMGNFLREALHAKAAEAATDVERRHACHATIDRLAHPVANAAQRLWESCATVSLMSMRLPDCTLHLGHDVPALPGAPLFPAQLATIELPALAEVLEQYGALVPEARVRLPLLGHISQEIDEVVTRVRGHATAVGSGALDWASLDERLRYVLEYFRSRQQDPALHSPPFTADQQRAMAEGTVPEGEL